MGWVSSGDRTLSAAEFNDRVARAATVLAELGIQKGDGVALYLRNDLAFFEASFGAGLLGVYPVPVNWHYTPDEAGYLLRDSGVKLLLIHADLLPPIAAAIPEGLKVVVVATPPEIQAAYGVSGDLPPGLPVWHELLDKAAPWEREPEVAPSTIIYTSGTTGRPKGVWRDTFTPEQAAATTRMLGWSYGYTDYLEGRRDPAEIVTAVVGPVYHAAPNAHSGFSIRAGANVIIVPRFDAEGLLKLIEDRRITHLNMVPIMFNRLLRLPAEVRSKYDLSSLRYVTHAAAPCPPPVKRAMIEWWGPIINEYYGSTETGAVVYCTAEEWLKHPGTVGKALPNVKLRILGDDGEDVAQGTPGDLYVRLTTGLDFTSLADRSRPQLIDRPGQTRQRHRRSQCHRPPLTKARQQHTEAAGPRPRQLGPEGRHGQNRRNQREGQKPTDHRQHTRAGFGEFPRCLGVTARVRHSPLPRAPAGTLDGPQRTHKQRVTTAQT